MDRSDSLPASLGRHQWLAQHSGGARLVEEARATPLTETKADGTPYLSGTEWEFENALAANKPVFVYRRAERVLLDPDEASDLIRFDRALQQWRGIPDEPRAWQGPL